MPSHLGNLYNAEDYPYGYGPRHCCICGNEDQTSHYYRHTHWYWICTLDFLRAALSPRRILMILPWPWLRLETLYIEEQNVYGYLCDPCNTLAARQNIITWELAFSHHTRLQQYFLYSYDANAARQYPRTDYNPIFTPPVPSYLTKRG